MGELLPEGKKYDDKLAVYMQNELDSAEDIAYIRGRINNMPYDSVMEFNKELFNQYNNNLNKNPYSIVITQNQLEWHNNAFEKTLESLVDRKKEEESIFNYYCPT